MTAPAWQDIAALVDDDPASILDERDRRRLLPFTRRMFPAYEDAPHIARLTNELESAVRTPNARLIVTMPPRHSKSLNVSEHLPAWYLGTWPDKRIVAASHTARLANTFSRRVRNKFADPLALPARPHRRRQGRGRSLGHRRSARRLTSRSASAAARPASVAT